MRLDLAAELQAQRCKACWNADGMSFYVPDETWAAVVPPPLRDRVVCLRCFDRLAAAAGVDYAGEVSEVCFIGDMGSFSLAIESRASGPF